MIRMRSILLVVVLAATSCQKSITERMVTLIEDGCSSKDTCYVDLLQLEPVWDHLYVFSPATTRDEVLRILPGSNFDPEIRGLIVLLKDSLVVESEYLHVELEGRSKLEFAFPAGRNIMIFSRDQPLAIVNVINVKKRKFYELSKRVTE